MGRAQASRGDYSGSVRVRLEAYDIMKAAVARHPDDPEAKAGLVGGWPLLSSGLILVGDHERAVREGTAMVALTREMVARDPGANELLANALEGIIIVPSTAASAAPCCSRGT